MVVVEAGLFTTVQDAGRPGWRAFGMPVAGPMDRYAFALANLLAGNPPGAAALEMTLTGPTLRFEEAAWVSTGGADMRARLDGAPVRPWSAFRVEEGSVLAFSSAAAGARGYLAVCGGVDVPIVMGSRATFVPARVGGVEGRPLRVGDRLRWGPAARTPARPRALSPALVPPWSREVTLRVVPGPQDDRFTVRGVRTFFEARYTVTNRNDRMGYRLDGDAVEHSAGPDIVSDALCPGAVQVPGDGQPMVMTVDCQTVGGYAKIGTVIGTDLGALAQARTGDWVRFAPCTLEDAVEALRAERDALERLAAALAAG